MNVKNNLNFFHRNISSLFYDFPELHTLLAKSEIELDIIGTKKSRLKSNKSHLTNITLPNYNTELFPTNGPNGGALSYLKEDIIYKKSKRLESIFIDNFQFSKSLIVVCIYRHPCIELSEFNDDFFTYLFEKLLRKKTKT